MVYKIRPELEAEIAKWNKESVLAERERCAKIAEEHIGGGGAAGVSGIKLEIAAKIREQR